MFKLESYITPLLLSYVDKYIKNFRPEDSQVSLWGGDASFHNLDLRLEVLEQELQLPFSFVSGHVHELLIHVPWTKLASEPIKITINTIECILKLRGTEDTRSSDSVIKDRKRSIRRDDVAAPPGYVQSVVNKIVSNITIYCKNLILKYVEEDIVLSMNVKLLTFESANEHWQPAYSAHMTMRKLITISDLTICLDKRNSSGKIDVYQEPMLYRCSFIMHLLRHYHTSASARASTTRLDIHCNNMEFSMTEQQIPMLMRLILLMCALKDNEFRRESEIFSETDVFPIEKEPEPSLSWAGWAWSYVPSIFPSEDLTEELPVLPTGHTLQIGLYVDSLSLTFTVSESRDDRSYYSQKKLKYWPVLLLRLQGLYSGMILHGLKWLNFSCGISQILLMPQGYCTCSQVDVPENVTPSEYFTAGSVRNSHKTESLFDAESVENKGHKKLYNVSWDYHMNHVTEAVMLDKTPAFAIDLVRELIVPEGMTNEELSDLSGDYEYSNVCIRSLMRIVVGPFRLRVSAGLVHRTSSLLAAASAYDYAPYGALKPRLSRSALHPPSEDDYDALNDHIPVSVMQFTIITPAIEFQLFDHPFFEASKGNLFRKRKKMSTVVFPAQVQPFLPKLTLECQHVNAKIQDPIYTKRLIHTVCQLPNPPSKMFDACFTDVSVKLTGFSSRLILASNRHTTIVIPFNASFGTKTIINEEYWTNPDISHKETRIDADSITMTATKPRSILVATIIDRLLKLNCEDSVNYITNSSLLYDAAKDSTQTMTYLEVCIEDMMFKKVVTNSTFTINMSLGSVKAFMFDPVELCTTSTSITQPKLLDRIIGSSPTYYPTREIQQVLFISGPEYKLGERHKGGTPLFKAVIQFPLDPLKQNHPSILLFNLQEIRICVDPLLCRWMLYTPKIYQQKSDFIYDFNRKSKPISEASSSIIETPRRYGTPHESVHSSSERDVLFMPSRSQTYNKVEDQDDIPDLQETAYLFLKKWFTVWKGMLLFGDISQTTIYFPVKSLSAVGSQGIQEAVHEAMSKENPPEILVITLPHAKIRSAGNKQSLLQHINTLPIKLPQNIWSTKKSNFPWSISISDMSCYSWQHGSQLNFLKPVSLNATVGLSTKAKTDLKQSKSEPLINHLKKSNTDSLKSEMGALSVCVHIDMTPTKIIMSEVQICLIASILYGLLEVYNNLIQDTYAGTLMKPAVVLTGISTQSTLSPTLLKESTLDSGSDHNPNSTFKTEKIDSDNVKLTAWIQWTITRCSVEMLSYQMEDLFSDKFSYMQKPNLKLVIEAEDIVSSLDFQSVYLKIKSKVGSASIQHFLYSKFRWHPGQFLGLIMKTREDLPTSEKPEDTSFANIIVTRASCQHTHSLWGTTKKSKSKDCKDDGMQTVSTRFITEIVITLQPVDFLLSLTTLQSFYMVFEPLLQIPIPVKTIKNANLSVHVNNKILPLAYLECKGFRVIVPSIELRKKEAAQDLCLFQIDSISLTPDPENSICRTPMKPDIYQQAARTRILNIPGSEIEDRQYELNIRGISLSTSTWEEFNTVLNLKHKSNASQLITMNENPALEWNMSKGRFGFKQSASLWPIINKFDLLIVIAPAMVYRSDVVCGHSVEINFVSNIDVTVSLTQLKLASALHNELDSLIELFLSDVSFKKRPKVYIPYTLSGREFLDFDDSIFQQETTDGYHRDSGFETSDLRSSISVKTKDSSQIRKISESEKSSNIFFKSTTSISSGQTYVPLDILLTGGKISLILYEFNSGTEQTFAMKFYRKYEPKLKDIDKDKGYDASEEGSVDERHNPKIKKFQPLLYISFSQPNAFLSDLQASRKMQLSCFDVRVKVSGTDYEPLKGIPTENDFSVNLLETRSGTPNSNTGVLPAFFTLKWCKSVGKPTLDIEFAKPTKILFCMNSWLELLNVKNRIVHTLNSPGDIKIKSSTITQTTDVSQVLKRQKSIDSYSKFKQIKEKLHGISVLNVRFAQVVLTVKTENQTELNLSIEKLNNNLNISNRPERITNVISLDSITLGVTLNSISRLLLNPWTISIEICFFWESWQSIDSNPQIQISAESDCVMIDISQNHIKCLEIVQNEVTEFLNNFSSQHTNLDSIFEEAVKVPPSDKEQHYKDDLRAGAFHFVDSASNNIDDLPLPYQVMFWNRNVSAMAWRYPQPRALTKIRVFPVPFKVTSGNQEDHQILCHLDYWSDCHGCYQPYTQFYLSESEVCHLELPQRNGRPAVACTWRVVLTSANSRLEDEYNHSRVLISPRALAGCIRVDSYFNKVLIPELTIALHISKISISLYNRIDKNLSIIMPGCLKNYLSDLLFPEDQCFLTLTLDNTRAYVATWHFETAALDVTTIAKCNILDYNFLTEQIFIEPFSSTLEVCVNKTLNINFISKPIHFKVGASVAHTLGVGAQMWGESWKNNYSNDNSSINLIIMTHYVVCNDTNIRLRFGQAGFEDILLPSRHCHLYSWRSQKCKQMIRIAIEEFHWNWSEPFRIDKDGTELCEIADDNNVVIVVTVKSLSATQKQVIFSGQLTICNTLIEHFEFKVIESTDKSNDKALRNAAVHIISGKSIPPSILLNSNRKYYLRLRFFGLESAWSGDIPLVENIKCAQPWLVKVPLQERGQFLSIWCRIIIQKFTKGTKILAILWPLFMVKSNLPINSKVHIETPTLNVHLESTVKGKGEYQQLYCPGTIDHSHQLSFQLDDTPTSNPYVPLNYSLVDQKQFFKKLENEDIDEILDVINNYDNSKWPYFGDEFDEIDYIIEDQPLTHVQVRYQNACQYSSALLVELLPWSLLLNTLGCPIAIIINEKELCRISHHGICAPPKLDETFYLGVGIGGTWNLSLPLQLAKSDWSQAFYMPKINGTIPLEGSIKTSVKCDPYICIVLINSSIVNEIRLLKISSTHVLTNHMPLTLHGICFAVPDNGVSYNIPKQLEKHAFAIAPHQDNSNAGLSIIQWYVIGQSVDTSTDYSFYISLSINPKLGWSCPVPVDKNVMRRSISVQAQQRSIPIVLVSREYKGQVFLSLHHDPHPQLLITNRSGIKLFCAQYSGGENSTITYDCEHLKWLCSIEDEQSTFYTMPIVSEKFPEILPNSYSENLVFASDPEGDPQGFQWSSPVTITNFNDQFVRIPFYGDVRVSISSSTHFTVVTIESFGQVEISARDIRVRLSMHENEVLAAQDMPKKSHDYIMSKMESKDTESTCTFGSTYFSAEESLPSTSDSLAQNIYQLHNPQTLPTLPEHSNMDVQNIYRALEMESDRDRLLISSSKTEWSHFKVLVFIKGVTLTLTSDLENGSVEKTEILAVTCDNIAVSVNQSENMEVKSTIGEIQIDNQLYSRGSYDFPVVLIGEDATQTQSLNSLNLPINQLISYAQADPLMSMTIVMDMWKDTLQNVIVKDIADITIAIKPLSTYIEDTYISTLMEHMTVLTPSNLIIWNKQQNKIKFSLSSGLVSVPEHISWESVVLARPLVLHNFVIEPVSVLLSVHSSIKMYIALDQSPLQFGRFEKKKLITTAYRLGHAITMHYLSGAIFGAGWVVGSLELLGSPGGLARAMGTGLRDFVSLPYRGFVQGPWAFLIGITHGSASLMKHVTAGTLQSVTKLASSVARNLDRLTLDEEHLQRTEEQRRLRPQGVTQGFLQGLTGLGISLLGAVGGIAHHPLQSVMCEGATPRSLVTGVGLGLVGVITKPLSGAAELVALTGQGLLQGAGWNQLPEARMKPSLCHTFSCTNSVVKYNWKFTQAITNSNILFVTEATFITNCGQYEAVALVLTLDAVIIINTDEDVIQRVLKLNELSGIDNANDPTLLTLKLCLSPRSDFKPKNEDENVVEMDPASRARIADYVKNTAGLMNFPENQSSEHSEISISPDLSGDEACDENKKEQTTLIFYVNPQSRNYFLCLLLLAKQHHETYNFPVL